MLDELSMTTSRDSEINKKMTSNTNSRCSRFKEDMGLRSLSTYQSKKKIEDNMEDINSNIIPKIEYVNKYSNIININNDKKTNVSIDHILANRDKLYLN
jgi:hypothetical protein